MSLVSTFFLVYAAMVGVGLKGGLVYHNLGRNIHRIRPVLLHYLFQHLFLLLAIQIAHALEHLLGDSGVF